MKRRPRRNHTPGFKAKVALAAIKGDRTLVQLAEQFERPPQSNHGVEGSARRRGCRYFRAGRRCRNSTAHRGREDATRQDRRADVGE